MADTIPLSLFSFGHDAFLLETFLCRFFVPFLSTFFQVLTQESAPLTQEAPGASGLAEGDEGQDEQGAKLIRMPWSKVEEESLRSGVDKYGESAWTKILEDTAFCHELRHRSNVDLKDKYRNMKRAEYIIEGFNARVDDNMDEGAVKGPRVIGGGLMVSQDVVRLGRKGRKVVRPASHMPSAVGNGNSNSPAQTPKKSGKKKKKKKKGEDDEDDEEGNEKENEQPTLAAEVSGGEGRGGV